MLVDDARRVREREQQLSVAVIKPDAHQQPSQAADAPPPPSAHAHAHAHRRAVPEARRRVTAWQLMTFTQLLSQQDDRELLAQQHRRGGVCCFHIKTALMSVVALTVPLLLPLLLILCIPLSGSFVDVCATMHWNDTRVPAMLAANASVLSVSEVNGTFYCSVGNATGTPMINRVVYSFAFGIIYDSFGGLVLLSALFYLLYWPRRSFVVLLFLLQWVPTMVVSFFLPASLYYLSFLFGYFLILVCTALLALHSRLWGPSVGASTWAFAVVTITVAYALYAVNVIVVSVLRDAVQSGQQAVISVSFQVFATLQRTTVVNVGGHVITLRRRRFEADGVVVSRTFDVRRDSLRVNRMSARRRSAIAAQRDAKSTIEVAGDDIRSRAAHCDDFDARMTLNALSSLIYYTFYRVIFQELSEVWVFVLLQFVSVVTEVITFVVFLLPGVLRLRARIVTRLKSLADRLGAALEECCCMACRYRQRMRARVRTTSSASKWRRSRLRTASTAPTAKTDAAAAAVGGAVAKGTPGDLAELGVFDNDDYDAAMDDDDDDGGGGDDADEAVLNEADHERAMRMKAPTSAELEAAAEASYLEYGTRVFRDSSIEFMLRHWSNVLSIVNFFLVAALLPAVPWSRPFYQDVIEQDALAFVFVGISGAVDVVSVGVVLVFHAFVFKQATFLRFGQFIRAARYRHFLWVLVIGAHVCSDLVAALLVNARLEPLWLTGVGS